MVNWRNTLKALSLCAMLVGVLAFASIAQAEVGAFWLVKGVKISESLLPTVEVETDVALTLLTKLGTPEKGIHIKCTTTETVGAHLVEPLGKILGKLRFGGCKFLELVTEGGTTKELGACEPSAEGVKGRINTNNITGLIKLHEPKAGEKEAVIEAVPTTAGTPFGTFALGEECAFGEKITLEGTIFLKDCVKNALTDLVKHLLVELPALTKLTVNGGAKRATIDGSAWAFLGGTHKGLTFAVHPG